jgi:hypothetical protein
MAGAGKKTFTAGETLTASDVNNYLMDQSVMVFGGTAARSSAVPTPSEGMISYQTDTDAIEAYDGTNWVTRVSTSVPFATSAGTGTLVWAGVTTTSVTVTFPASRFTQTPIITITNASGLGSLTSTTYRALSVTTSSFTISGTATAVTTATGSAYWQAVQMTSTSASG